MINYLQHIIKQDLWFRSPIHNLVAFSCDERLLKFNREVIDTWVDVFIELKKAPTLKRGAFFMVLIEKQIDV
jgi:hypothetical protein